MTKDETISQTTLAILRRSVAYAALVLLCFITSFFTELEPRALFHFLLSAVLLIAYLALLWKRPHIAFPVILLVATGFVGLLPLESLPTLPLPIGTIAVTDILIPASFIVVFYRHRETHRNQPSGFFTRPILYLLVVVLFAAVYGIFLLDIHYRQVVRFARIYMYYLSYFILLLSIPNNKSYAAMFRLVIGIVVLGSLIQVFEFITDQAFWQYIGRPDLISSSHYQTLQVGTDTITRWLGKTGNFPLLFSFFFLFSAVRAKEARRRNLYLLLLLLTLFSVVIMYGRTLFIMILAGVIVGLYLDEEYRKKYGLFLVMAVLLLLLLFFLYVALPTSGQLTEFRSLGQRYLGIWKDVVDKQDTFGLRLDQFSAFHKIPLMNWPFGAGLTDHGTIDVGFLTIFLHLGILGLLFYPWVIRTFLVLFSKALSIPMSATHRTLVLTIGCYIIPQLLVLPFQDPFSAPLGILLLTFTFFSLERTMRTG